MTASILDPKSVSAIFGVCRLQPNEDKPDAILVDGIMLSVRFDPEALADNKELITTWLLELPEPFRTSSGGGWSFLQACEDRHGNLWTGEQRIMEQLFLLGMGIGKVKSLAPRVMWAVLPGGMPYYAVIDNELVQ